jgi:threonine 3-dehydrogenase
MGADATFLATDPDWPAQARALTAGEGAQVLLEMSGAPSAIRDGFRALRNGGVAALLGLPSRPVELDLPNDIIFKGATVLGINGRLMYETWYQVESFLTTGRLDIRSLITDVLPLEEYDEAFRRLAAHDAVKVLLRVSG